jgi:hypothetical protein
MLAMSPQRNNRQVCTRNSQQHSQKSKHESTDSNSIPLWMLVRKYRDGSRVCSDICCDSEGEGVVEQQGCHDFLLDGDSADESLSKYQGKIFRHILEF